jgi:glycerol kinase
LQADVIGASVVRAKNLESTGLGAGLLAGLGGGIWSSQQELRLLNPEAERFEPKTDRSADYNRWLTGMQATSKF